MAENSRRRRASRRTSGALALFLLTAITTVLFSDRAAGQAADPLLTWRTIRTRHFVVHYHEPLGLVARRVAAVAERAHARLAPLLDHEPRERTEIVLSDNSDSANGSATAIPYNTMRLFASAPEDITALSDYDDWLTVLITHEHTHVLHLDTIEGIPAIINSVLGKVYPPNAVQPRWFLEGLAVHEESRFTSGGRIRSSIFDMYLRTDVLTGSFLSLAEMSNAVDRYPRGNVWYLYGSRFVDYVARTYGHGALTQMSHDYGSQLVPYGVNRTAERATGKTWIELYEDFRADQVERYETQADEIRAQGVVEGTNLTNHGQDARAPRFLDDRTLVYWAGDGRSRSQLRMIDPESGEVKGELDRVSGVAYSSPHPDGRYVYYSAFATHRDLYFFYDLYRYDRETRERERLTEGMRAQEPDLSPDGRRVVFTVNGAATTHLAIAETSDIAGTREIVLRSRRFDQLYTPRWSPDGRTIALSAWRRGGYRDILLFDVASGRVEEVTHDRAIDQGPCWSPDGRALFFSSDRSGVSNIYAYDLASGVTERVTNVLGGAFSPAVSPDGRRLAYLGFARDGWDIYAMDLDPSAYRPAAPYHDTRPAPSETDGIVTATSEHYDPLPTLYPRSYMLELGQDGFGTQIATTVSGSDVVGYHSYSLRIGVGLVRGNVNADFGWVYQRTPLPLSFRLFHAESPRGGLILGGENQTWIERAYGGEIGARYFFPRPFISESVGLTYSLTQIEKAAPFGGELDPNDPPPSLPDTGLFSSVRLSYFWSDVVRNAWDVTPSEGRSIGLNLSVAHPYLGSRFTAVSTTFSITQYLENPWIHHHVLALRYAGGLSAGDIGRRGTFSVGGFPVLNPLDQLLENSALGGQALRGYPPFVRSGTQFHLVQAEYRFPIFRPMWSVETLPAFLQRLWGAVFFDVGDAFFGELDLSTLRYGIGGELYTDFMLGYFLTYTLRLGIARGLSEGGETQVYGNIGVPF
jgi:Tol biopolymer transport system component